MSIKNFCELIEGCYRIIVNDGEYYCSFNSDRIINDPIVDKEIKKVEFAFHVEDDEYDTIVFVEKD